MPIVLPTPPAPVTSAVSGAVNQARTTYNQLPQWGRTALVLIIGVLLISAVIKLVGSIIGRVVGTAISVVVAFVLWHYLPTLWADLHH